ncbi:phage tail protein [Serratia fonticola]|uniref:phage tail protein n=1 Tax=Serratia fonticola TaxID=47917 RepID=UPI001377C9C8|nr:phage tail protein [Serratia fonticola]NCG53735.1 phage tail protein [Serratia fonticola]
MMMALGMYVFVISTTPYQEFQHDMAWRHPSNSRVGQRPATQFLGPDEESVTLSGTLYPELTGGMFSLLALQWMADTGKAWPLIEGTGMIYGMYVITGLTRARTFFSPNGYANKIEFTLTLKRVDESLSDLFGDLGEQLDKIKDSATTAMNKGVDAIKDAAGTLLS